MIDLSTILIGIGIGLGLLGGYLVVRIYWLDIWDWLLMARREEGPMVDASVRRKILWRIRPLAVSAMAFVMLLFVISFFQTPPPMRPMAICFVGFEIDQEWEPDSFPAKITPGYPMPGILDPTHPGSVFPVTALMMTLTFTVCVRRFRSE